MQPHGVGSAIIPAGAKAYLVVSLANFAESVCFVLVHAFPLAREPECALRGAVECHARRIAPGENAAEAQTAHHIHDNAAFDIVAESNVVGGSAQPFRPVVGVGIALGGGRLLCQRRV